MLEKEFWSEDLCDAVKMGFRERGNFSEWFATKLEMRLEEWIWRIGRRGGNLELVYLLHWKNARFSWGAGITE